MQTKREIKMKIIEYADSIAEILYKKRDCEIRTSPNGIVVIAVKKEVVAKRQNKSNGEVYINKNQ